MEIWMQPMRTQNLTQAQELGSYAQSIQSELSLANKPRMSRKCGTLVWIVDAVMLHKALFSLV